MFTRKPSEPSRTAAGNLMIFVAAGICMVVVVAIVCIFTLVLMGGSTQLQNAVDSGALSVARRSLTEIAVKPKNDPELFEDIITAKGEVNAENYNRMVAKTYLLAINQTAMATTGQSTSESQQSVFEAFERTRTISKELNIALEDNETLEDFFHNCADANSLRMLGGPKIVLEKPIPNAYLDRGAKTSIYVEPNDMPEGFNSATMQSVSRGNRKWLPGYIPLETNGQGFCLTPQPSRPPHLVSLKDFSQNTHKPTLRGDLPAMNCLPVLPNSFKLLAKVTNHNQTLKTVACAEADSVTDGYPMELPRDWVRIRNIKPSFRIFFHENTPIKKGGRLVGMWGQKESPPKPCLTAYATTLRKQYEAEPNAWDKFVGDEYTDFTRILRTRYEQRGKEILSGTPLTKHDPPFADSKLAEGSVAYLYRNAKDKKLLFREQGDGDLGEAPWVVDRTDRNPDGQGGHSDQSQVTKKQIKVSIPVPKECAIAVMIDQQYRWYWTPGTGTNGVLGELSMGRMITFRFLGDGPQPDVSMFENYAK